MGEEDKACGTERPMPRNDIGIGLVGSKEAQEVRIKKMLNGFTVTVGCRTVVFEQKNQMLLELARYYDNPQQVEKEYMEKFSK